MTVSVTLPDIWYYSDGTATEFVHYEARALKKIEGKVVRGFEKQ
ncbi:hypothetical protein [Lactobacillus helveticus]|nr:hypothetical protein [Lactobacillus helveticus]